MDLLLQGKMPTQWQSWPTVAERIDASALLVATLPVWLPLIAFILISAAGSAWRLAKARGGLLASLLAPWLAQRAARLLRKVFRQRRRQHATQSSGTLRRSMASVVNLQACAGVETGFAGCVVCQGCGHEELRLTPPGLYNRPFAPLTRSTVPLPCSEVPGAVSVAEFQAFKSRIADMPRATPAGEWQRMLDKETSVMTYQAWRHNLPVRGTALAKTLSSRRPGGAQT